MPPPAENRYVAIGEAGEVITDIADMWDPKFEGHRIEVLSE